MDEEFRNTIEAQIESIKKNIHEKDLEKKRIEYDLIILRRERDTLSSLVGKGKYIKKQRKKSGKKSEEHDETIN